MTEGKRHLIITDECQSLKFLEHALIMLQIPYIEAHVEKLKNKDFLENQGVTQIYCCEHLLDTLPASIRSFPLIVIHQSKTTPKDLLTHLATPFSVYELKSALIAAQSGLNSYHAQQDESSLKNLVGESEAIVKIKRIISQVANTDSNILILGPSGSGKEVIASCIHQLSKRKVKPFVPINCGAIPAELMESELFGHEKGSFTGAVSRRAGRFELANEGTIFLDEIGDMPLPMQVKLLRVIQDRRIERVGATSFVDVDVRLIAATNRHLEEMIAKNQFREDLFYRLNVIPIHAPALCDRRTDIPLLIQQQLIKITKRIPNNAIFSAPAIEMMCQYDWPGNIRELSNFVERMVVLCQDKVIEESDVVEQLDTLKILHNVHHKELHVVPIEITKKKEPKKRSTKKKPTAA